MSSFVVFLSGVVQVAVKLPGAPTKIICPVRMFLGIVPSKEILDEEDCPFSDKVWGVYELFEFQVRR